ncbi:single-stranded-DNA-specific exonuclease RecJ [Olsenella uli]|uniref:single-stranded-DNA-specific exonuclease RecJ n=1 Tax=Olsenella uli TaxID=133926 RepID=UPI00325FB576
MPGLLGSRRWELLPQDAAAERCLREGCGVSSLVARTLAARGVKDVDEARRFLTPSLERDWADPLLIPGMEGAAQRVGAALDRHETIAVFGDFDVDGMSATCLLTLALRKLGGDVHPYIPYRFGEGYGLSDEALSRVIEGCDPDLIVTVDNGIAAREEVSHLGERGIDVVVTDHHEPAELVPVGVPVTDPKIDPACVSRELAGAGVALKLVQVLGERRGQPDLWRRYTEVATLGTISDMMLLEGENRALVADGIAQMRQTRRPGIVALAATSGVDLSSITADELPFSLIPRLNAAGRMGTTDVAFDLLLTDDAAVAAVLAGRLERTNAERREIESRLTDEAMEKVEATYDGGRVVVVGGEGWHEGVKGIVASRIANRYHVPSILFTISDGVARGSGRSVGTVDLFRAVERCSDVLVRFGGHAGAVGVTCAASNLDAFRSRLGEVMGQLPEEQFVDRGEVSAPVGLSEMSVEAIDSLEVLQPFGQGNKKPLFAVHGVCMRNRTRVGASGNHLRFVATDGVNPVPAIMFRTPQIERACDCEAAVDLVFEPVNETWQGRTKPKLMVRDILYRDAVDLCGDACEAATSLSDDLFSRAGETLSHDAQADAVPSDAPARRAQLGRLGTDELTDELRRAMIGDHALLPAQREALDRLAAGKSVLCVMATGRGKSLIFHIHAAREAIGRGRASVFVYPLRALVADQSYHLAGSFGRLGMSVRVLTGETPLDERDDSFADLALGSVDVLLTTPEFLAIHAERFASSGRVGFVVVDEAHHAGVAKGGSRSSYTALPRVLERLGGPVALAVTATAEEGVAREICRLLSINADDGVVVDRSVRENLHVVDYRGLHDREAALVSVVATGMKTVVYVNSRERSVSLARMLRKNVPELGQRIAFYNAGLTREDRFRVEAAFRDGRLSCIVSTSAFGEGVNLPDIRNVVLYHMPFGSIEFNQMSGRAGRDGDDAWVYLLFGSRDARINERIICSAAPGRDDLVVLYRTLMTLAGRAGARDGETPLSMGNADIAQVALDVDPTARLDEHSVSCGISIFRELGFLGVSGYGPTRRISMAPSPERMRLERSIRYLEGLRSRDAFSAFRDWVLTSGQQEMLERINKPITPGFGCVVDR